MGGEDGVCLFVSIWDLLFIVVLFNTSSMEDIVTCEML